MQTVSLDRLSENFSMHSTACALHNQDMSETYSTDLPKMPGSPESQMLRDDAVEEDRLAVRQAVHNAVARLVSDGGIAAVTMTRAAEGAGISQATLNRYFSDTEVLLLAWREQQVSQYLAHLRGHAGPGVDAMESLRTVLEVYLVVSQQSSIASTPTHLYNSIQSQPAEEHRQAFLTDLIRRATRQDADTAPSARRVRTDLDASQLAVFVLYAVNSAAFAPTPAAARALAGVIIDGLTGSG